MRFCFSLILLFLVLFCNSQQYRLLHYNASNNFAEAYVYSIVQDENGYLWMGTSTGVYKYNGFSFEQFTQSDSLASDFITTSATFNQNIWFGHRNGQLSKKSISGFEKVQTPFDEEGSVVELQVVGDVLWGALYSSKLFKIDLLNQISEIPVQGDLGIVCFRFISENKILLGTDNGLYLAEQKAEGVVVEKQLIDIPKTKVVAIESVGEYDFIIATEDKGVYAISISSKSISGAQLVPSEALSDQLLADVMVDLKGTLWLATFGGGLFCAENYKLQDSEVDLKVFEDSPQYTKVLFLDRDENIWLGNYGSGATRVFQNPFSRIEFEGSVNAIISDSLRQYVAIGNTIYLKAKAPLGKQEQKVLELPVEIITTLELDGHILWVGAYNGGVFKVDTKTHLYERIAISKGRLENNISALSSVNGVLWIGTAKGLAQYNIDVGEVQWCNIASRHLPHNVVNDIYVDVNNIIYVATQSNIVTVSDGKHWNKIPVSSENGAITINSLVKGSDNALWLASNGKGLYRVQTDSIMRLQEHEGLYSNFCYSIEVGSDGYLWVMHRNGLSRINEKYFTVRSVSDFAGIHEEDVLNPTAIHVDSDSVLWFGLNDGVIAYNPQIENVHSRPPLLNISAVKFNGINYSFQSAQVLKSGKYKFLVDYVGVDLKEPKGVSYQSRLLGYDDEWCDITKANQAEFANLEAGKYVFELISSSSEGINSEIKRFSFKIRKSIWKQWWFYVVAVSLLLLLIATYVKRREYKLIEYNRQLEQGVKDRTRRIERQKTEIERQGEVINRKNIDITDSIKYARTIQSAIFPPKDILDEALPHSFLINMPKDIVSGDFCWYTKCEDKYVVAVSDCTGHGVPGAIMSMLAITLFNEVVNNLKVTKAGHILDLVRDKVISALNQHKKDNPSYDGLNTGLCVLDKKNGTLQYAGAFHNLVHISNGELNVIKAERTSIGYSPLGNPAFATHNVEYKKGDMFYLFSDGYQDQFGGDEDRKFTTKRLLEVFKSIHSLSLSNQQMALAHTLEQWMGDTEQTDDVILLGFRL